MDFGTLLHMAKKNNENSKDNNKFYSTKFAPPKKESKEKRLSENIQKFLQKREQEERERQQEHRDKVAKLLAMRDEKSKNKIRKMLKVTKSANKSVLEDAINDEHTAITLQGPEQPDEDDYGYTSTEANAFYRKYLEKVKNVTEDKGFAPSRPQSIKDLSSTKERVKAAITREIEDKNGPRQRSSTNVGNDINAVDTRIRSSNKTICDPEVEKMEEERKKKEELKKKQARKPVPPPMDFQSLLKLAEKKQHEPIEIIVQVKKSEPERLLTLKEKKELEDRKRAREERERKQREFVKQSDKYSQKVIKEHSSTNKDVSSNALGRIPKLHQPSGNNSKVNVTPPTTTKTTTITKLNKNENNIKNQSKLSKPCQSNVRQTSISAITTSGKTKTMPESIRNSKSTTTQTKMTKTTSSATKTTVNNHIKNHHMNGNSKMRELSSGDTIKAQHLKEAVPVRNNHVPSSNTKKKQKDVNYSNKSSNNQFKRRILDDDSEYDSEMDDFIDDGDLEEDYSSHIKAIFGYDRSKYCNIDDEDDEMMESSFAQVQREELISKKIGIQEDLEDMKLEAIEKKRKMMLKKRRFHE